MSNDNYKRFDSDDTHDTRYARLTKDADVKDPSGPGKAPFVRLTYVSTSRNEQDEDIWIEATVQDRQADLAAFLKKGDVIGVNGHLCLSSYEKDGQKRFSHKIRRAELHIPPAMFSTLKERGFTPGAKTQVAPPPKAPATKVRPVIEIPD